MRIIIWQTLILENLQPYGLRELVEDGFDASTYTNDIGKEYVKVLCNTFTHILWKSLKTRKRERTYPGG